VVGAVRILKAEKNEKRRFEHGRERVRLSKSRGYPLDVRHKVVQFIEGGTHLSASELLEAFEKEIDDLFEEGAFNAG
jgi:hypothetical protein